MSQWKMTIYKNKVYTAYAPHNRYHHESISGKNPQRLKPSEAKTQPTSLNIVVVNENCA